MAGDARERHRRAFLHRRRKRREKFEAWARTVPATLRNPLYHWTHLELKRPFGITELLSERNARAVFDRCNEQLQQPEFSTQGLLRQFNVAIVCTTDDPADSLEHHHALAERVDPDTRVVPTWRPDAALGIDDPGTFNAWLARLEAASGRSITVLADLLDALAIRFQAFHDAGCRASDHGLEQMYAEPATIPEVTATFDRVRAGNTVEPEAILRYKSWLLHGLSLMYHKAGWVQQYHLGALRNTNSRLRRRLGADTGLDSVGDFSMARPLARYLDRLDENNQLANTILYNLNPRDNELFATMIGSLFSRFVGMVTDSRSFLSYSRHEYFRRLVCNLLGDDVQRGLLPNDVTMLAELARNVSFFNAREYLGLELGRLGRESS